MSSPVIEIENISKCYRLGKVGSSTLREDIKYFMGKTISALRSRSARIKTETDMYNSPNYVWALKDINFSVNQGEVYGIIGKNGAGKSTLLKILSKVTAPTTGSIKIKGRVASLLEVGTGFHPDLTGRENVFLNGAMLGMTRREVVSKLDEIIAFSGVEKYIDTPVKRYSSGMYVRLAFAVAAHLEPEILIIDEVLAVGDIEFQKKCLGKMNDVRGHGRTILFVSHNMTAVKSLCTKAMMISSGKISHSGQVDDVVNAYFDIQSNLAKNTPIADRVDRGGNQSVKFIDLQINSKTSNVHALQILTTERLQLQVAIRNPDKNFSGKMFFTVYDQNDSCVAFLDSEASGMIIKSEDEIFRITASFPDNIALGTGKFILHMAIYNQYELSDFIDTAAEFEVIDSDFFGTGKSVPSEALMLIRNCWEVCKD